jgi:tetratricopeptide (TPR) repeat protein
VEKLIGHAFISYVREDAHHVDRLQQVLEAAGLSVWRDTASLWPGEDWRMKIRGAITDNALVFIACFSRRSVARTASYQNEELTLAIDQLRLRRPDDLWLIPVRFDDCAIPDLDIGSGRTLASIQCADLFGEQQDKEASRLLAVVQRLLRQYPAEQSATGRARHASSALSGSSDTAADVAASFGVTAERVGHAHFSAQQAMTGARPGDDNTAQSSVERLIDLPPRNPHFTGRNEKLAQLDAMLGRRHSVVAIHGLGGIGKSQLAQEYAHTRRDRYRIIWWVRAGGQVELTTDLIKLGRAFGLDVDTQPEHVVSAVRAQLGIRRDWLLVFDNVSDIEVIRELLPAGDGHVLITSRIRHWAGLAKTCPLEELPPDEAAHYIRASTGRDAPEIAELARELGCLPLALAQAVGYVTVHNCSVARYLELYRAAAQRILQQGPPPHGYPATVATTWRLHFESLPSAAIQILRLVAFLAPDAIPLQMLLDAAPAGELPEALRSAVCDPIAREAAIGELVNTSLLDRQDDDSVRVHVLVQEVARAELPKKEAAIWTSRAIGIIAAAFPQVPWLPESWQHASLLAPHAQAVATRVEPHQTKIAYPAACLLQAVATFLDSRGQYEAAKSIFARTVTLAAVSNNHKRLGEAFILTSQGANLLHLHDYMGALDVLNKALRIYDAALRPINPFVTQVLVNLARIATVIEDYPGARKRLERALLIVNTFGDRIPGERRSITSLLGRVLARMGEFTKAQEYLDRALVEAKAAFGAHHLYVADTLIGLAELAQLRGDSRAAEALFHEAIAIFEEQYGPGHPHIQEMITQFGQLSQS